jgi:hypothetical protein
MNMFRHREDHCPFDLWAPGERTKIENVGFSAYAKHEQEKEDVIQMILAAAARGETDLSIELDDHFSEEDVKYIEEEVYRRMR